MLCNVGWPAGTSHLDRIVGLYPHCAMGRAGRGPTANKALLLDTRPANLYQVACIYALTSRTNTQDRLRAFDLLSYGLKGGFGLDNVDTDSDLDPVPPTPSGSGPTQC
jgi:eukaryotic-like serine/threonine-protein kinase